MRVTLLATNVVAGFAAIVLTLRTVRYRKALGLTEEKRPDGDPEDERPAEPPQEGPAL
jgi:hypothetical protein